MNVASPLRYPGGKAAMADLLKQIRSLNGLGNYSIAEPFAGGAGASLSLLYQELAPEVMLNDLDPSIHAFWWAVTERNPQFLRMLANRRVSMAEWRRQRAIYRSTNATRLDRGFATFYLNRCNRSGIVMNGGPIGGTEQAGKWKLDARFNKTNLGARCKKVYEYRDRIRLSHGDGIDMIDQVDIASVFLFVDPPYYVKGQTVYLNALTDQYHARIAEKLNGLGEAPWVLTYDDCPAIRKLYRGWANIRPFGLRYTASVRRSGKELLITPKHLRVPATQGSAALSW